MKKNLFYSVAAALMAAGMVSFASCSKDAVSELADAGTQQEQSDGKVWVKLSFSSTPSVSYDKMGARGEGASSVSAKTRGLTRASLVANDKPLTDLYILDYDKATGKLLQVLHQTSDAEDFAEPSLALDYGTHTLKVVATRSVSPTLLDASGSLWSLADNTAFSIAQGKEDATEPLIWTSTKTSDTFGATQDVTIKSGDKQENINIHLERLVAKLVLHNTGTFPDDCATIQLSMNEYTQWNWQTFDVMDAVTHQRTSDVSANAGLSDKSIAYFFLTPKDGYTTDISISMYRKGSTGSTGSEDGNKLYTTITVPNVRLQRNHITTISGSYYDHQAGFSFTVNDEWDEEQNNVEF